jgi:hypothetical protein
MWVLPLVAVLAWLACSCIRTTQYAGRNVLISNVSSPDSWVPGAGTSKIAVVTGPERNGSQYIASQATKYNM